MDVGLADISHQDESSGPIDTKHARWPATARQGMQRLLDKTGSLVGITLGDRDSVMTLIPSATVEQIRTFLAEDAPKSRCSNPNPAGIMQLTASRDAQ